jgi:hypothetical protein
MMRLIFLAVLWGLTFILAAAASQFGGETIREFDALIEVRPDGALEVTETILVNAEGREIKRGIFRDFPTVYRAWHGRALAPFEVRSVTRNGADEPWRTEERQNGVRLYIGRADRNIPHGLHRYEIRYRTDWQLGFFADRDELYWNVTGNGWSFIIERATAAVVLPQALPEASLALEAYTGHAGEKGRDWRARADAEGPGALHDHRTADAEPGPDHRRRLAQGPRRRADARTAPGALGARQPGVARRPARPRPAAPLLPRRLAPLRARPGRRHGDPALRPAAGRFRRGCALPRAARLRRAHLRRRRGGAGGQGAPAHPRGRRTATTPWNGRRNPPPSRSSTTRRSCSARSGWRRAARCPCAARTR